MLFWDHDHGHLANILETILDFSDNAMFKILGRAYLKIPRYRQKSRTSSYSVGNVSNLLFYLEQMEDILILPTIQYEKVISDHTTWSGIPGNGISDT